MLRHMLIRYRLARRAGRSILDSLLALFIRKPPNEKQTRTARDSWNSKRDGTKSVERVVLTRSLAPRPGRYTLGDGLAIAFLPWVAIRGST
jgi:hypothetical protein